MDIYEKQMKLSILYNQANGINSQLDEANIKLQKYKTFLNQINDLEASIKTLSSDLDKVKVNISNGLNVDSNSVIFKVDEINNTVINQNLSIEPVKSEIEIKISNLENEINNLKKQLTQVKSKISSLNAMRW